MIELHFQTLPPSKNDLHQRTSAGIARSKRYASWLKNAGKEIMAQRARGQKCVHGPYKLTILALRPNDKRRHDLGNLLEATEDLLTHVHVIDDDSLSEMISLRWVTNGSAYTVRVEPAGVE